MRVAWRGPPPPVHSKPIRVLWVSFTNFEAETEAWAAAVPAMATHARATNLPRPPPGPHAATSCADPRTRGPGRGSLAPRRPTPCLATRRAAHAEAPLQCQASSRAHHHGPGLRMREAPTIRPRTATGTDPAGYPALRTYFRSRAALLLLELDVVDAYPAPPARHLLAPGRPHL